MLTQASNMDHTPDIYALNHSSKDKAAEKPIIQEEQSFDDFLHSLLTPLEEPKSAEK